MWKVWGMKKFGGLQHVLNLQCCVLGLLIFKVKFKSFGGEEFMDK